MAEERVPLTSLEGEEHSFSAKKKPKAREHESFCDAKLVSFVIVGVLTGLYVIAELAVAVYIHSLVLLSDGFHNLSDCVSLYIAFWARRAGKKGSSDAMSYGWARTEILGGLTNGCFLLSLCLYVILEAIPKFIEPEPMVGGWLFMVIAGCGLFINTFGTILFAITGQAHAHGHSHSHGHGHGHGHGEKKKKKEKETHEMTDSQKKEKKEKKEKHGHDHGHGHEHKDKKDKKDKKEKKEKHGHDHGHGHKDGKKKEKRDMNTHAVFLHYLGDAISSLMVLGAGILLHFFHGKWIDYIDPVSSLLICGLILYTTIPLVKRCSMILLQSTPGELSLPKLREKLLKVEGVIGLHDLHVWQLVDGMTIASVHVLCEEGSDFSHLVKDVKKVFHDKGIHSSSIQPEFVPRNNATAFCNQNCVKECEEDWCCKKVADLSKSTIEEYAITTPVV